MGVSTGVACSLRLHSNATSNFFQDKMLPLFKMLVQMSNLYYKQGLMRRVGRRSLLIIMTPVQRDSAFEWSQTELARQTESERSTSSPLPGFLRYQEFEQRVNNKKKNIRTERRDMELHMDSSNQPTSLLLASPNAEPSESQQEKPTASNPTARQNCLERLLKTRL